MMQLMFCAQMDPEKVWDNPRDPQGVDRYIPVVFVPADTAVAVNAPFVLHVTGFDTNGSIIGFVLSFDHGLTWDTVSAAYPVIVSWEPAEAGSHVVVARSMDNENLISPPDSFTVSVHKYPPIISRIHDTIVGQQASVVINVNAFDTNGGRLQYFWKYRTSGGNVHTDSTASPQNSFALPQGGPLFVIIEVLDNDENVSADTFSILFNRSPASAALTEPETGTIAQFVSYNEINDEGRVRCVFKGDDPDGDIDTLFYSLFIGPEAGTETPVFSGRGQSCIAEHLKPSVKYYWRLVARDLFGDSVASNGSFTIAANLIGPKGMKLVHSGSKSFIMGQAGSNSSEMPTHTVSFSSHFWMDTIEVTAHDFAVVLGFVDNSPSSGGALPAAHCTWYDAVIYCNARSRAENRDTVYSYQSIVGVKGDQCKLNGVAINMAAEGYRLPTEAEWEYACRGGAQTVFYWGDDQNEAGTYAWIESNSSNRAHPVAMKTPNAFGLYDMSGNVGEWCNDWFGAGYYAVSPENDPAGPTEGAIAERVIRGGGYQNDYSFARCAARGKMDPDKTSADVGFRVVLVNR